MQQWQWESRERRVLAILADRWSNVAELAVTLELTQPQTRGTLRRLLAVGKVEYDGGGMWTAT